ncbi:MAG TPA: hypothetical protein PKK48_04050 [Phycisphaerae bacterium]|nr:hypothetical protein [Phycisphaerae bacterium]HPS53074.1 hypothetical protein [Phycisphaerae bacterium]
MLCDKDLLVQARKMMEDDDLQAAKKILDGLNNKSIWVQNASAVWLMRTGRTDEAVRLLSQLVFPGGTSIMGLGVPDKIKLNLAEAMLLKGNISGAMSLIKSSDGGDPHCRKLVAAVDRWRKTLPLFSRMAVICGVMPYESEIFIDSPYGEP